MISLKRNKYFSILSSFIVVVVLFLQVVQKHEAQNHFDQKLRELNIENIIAEINCSNTVSKNTSQRQLSELNISHLHNYFDRYDLISLPGITDSKKIYGGNFSVCHRFKTFLSSHFSTST
jgi:hypothetical protein